MYSKLEEASFPLLTDGRYSETKFTKSGTFNPCNLKHGSRESFFLWKISDTILEIHEISSSKQLKDNRFIYNFAINPNETSGFYLQSQIEFIEYQDSGQNLIGIYLIASNWKLYQFNVFRPQQFNEFNANLSVLHNLQQTAPLEYQLISNLNNNNNNGHLLSFNRNTSFKMFDLHKILLCSSNQLMIRNCANQNNNNFIINTNNNSTTDTNNALSLFSSFFPSTSSSARIFNYTSMEYYKPVASRTIIGCLDNFGHFELYLLSGFNSSDNNHNINYQIHDKQVLDLPHHDINNGKKLLFYQYRHEYGICWFCILIFYETGGGIALQCQYKQREDKLYILNDFQELTEINNKLCIECAIYNNLLYIVAGSYDEYDVYFCDIKHYLKGGGNANININANKWKFQRMWKRSEYINRILDSIKNEFNFDTFYSYLQQTVNIYNISNIEQYKQKLHELILNFWLIRLVDDPTLELNERILNKQINKMINDENIKQLQPHWTIQDMLIINNENENENENEKINLNDNQTMTRIKFEAKLQTLMIAIIDKNNKNKNNNLNEIQRKEYIQYVWTKYNEFFSECLEKAKLCKKFIGLSYIRCANHNKNKKTVIIIKDNGFSVIRNMDYSEQIEVYFDRYCDDDDQDDALNDNFSEPPIRLHKFIAFCHNKNRFFNYNDNNIHNEIYHWFVACTWFYYQNNHIFNLLEDKDIISTHTFTSHFKHFIVEHDATIKRHTKKQINHLYQIHDQHNKFLQDIIELFTSRSDHDNDDCKDNDDCGDNCFNIDIGLISCIESSFASIVAARYSLLKSIYITYLYISMDPDFEQDMEECAQEMNILSNLLCGYFILSYLSSSIYETKQYLGINKNYKQQESVSTSKRYELLSNLQSSFRCGLCVGHYLRYKGININYLYFKSPLMYIDLLINNIFTNENANHIELIYNVVEFMFYERQFQALQKILLYIQYISPLFNYLLARCSIENNKDRYHHIRNNENVNYNNKMDEYVINLINECGSNLINVSLSGEKERYLLGLILTINDYGNNSEIDIFNLAPKDCIKFPKEFINKKKAVFKFSFNNSLSNHIEYEWSIILSYYFHIIHLYKNVLLKPQIVIQFAKKGIELINKYISDKNMDQDDDDDDDEKYEDDNDIINKVKKYTGINEKRAAFLCNRFNNNLEFILLSIYKSNFLLEIVRESLVMEEYSIAYKYLVRFDDYFCARQGIKEYVSTCCANKKMEPILNEKWNESLLQFTEWKKYLLSFRKCSNISFKPLNYISLVELIIYQKFALQFNIEDSFCFDLLYTFSMNQKQYQFAAKYMFEYAIRIQQYIKNKTKSTQKLQFHCLCHVLSAMDLMPNKKNKYLLLDFKMNTNDIFTNHKIVTYKQVKKWYILCESKNYLLSLNNKNKNGLNDKNISDLNIEQTSSELYRNGYYKQSLFLLNEFDYDLNPIFNKIIETLLFGKSNASELNWNIFEQLLLDYDNIKNHYKYTLNALKIILSIQEKEFQQEKFIIPSFIFNKIKNLNEKQIDVFIIPLIELLCQFGKIFESLRILYFTLNLTQVSIKNNRYNYQNHSLWKISQKLYAYCNTLQLKNEQQTLIKSLANWIARPQ